MNSNKLYDELFDSSNWIFPVSLLSLVSGICISIGWMNTDNRSKVLEKLDAEQRVRINFGNFDLSAEYNKQLEEVKKLREENTKFQNAVAEKTGHAKLLNESLQELKMYAGFTQLEGPGVLITLKDFVSKERQSALFGNINYEIIHSSDLLDVANLLWNAGAEAISINSQRIAQGSHFWCFGSTIRINGVQTSSPFYIKAIGDPDTLFGAVLLPGERINQIMTLGNEDMVKVEKVDKIIIPAYSGTTILKHAKIPDGESL